MELLELIVNKKPTSCLECDFYKIKFNSGYCSLLDKLPFRQDICPLREKGIAMKVKKNNS